MKELIGKMVVLDTNTSYIYIGELASFSEDAVVLENVDVHDRSDVPITKEKYIVEVRRSGVRDNRKKVYVLREHVISVSALDDVIKF